MLGIRPVLEAIVFPIWIATVALAVVATLVSYFIIGPVFPDRGATPIYGAKLPWFSKGHAAQLRQYHEMCVREGRSLVWSTYMRAFVASWPWLVFAAIALSLLAVSL